jgi:hypothetical protein
VWLYLGVYPDEIKSEEVATAAAAAAAAAADDPDVHLTAFLHALMSYERASIYPPLADASPPPPPLLLRLIDLFLLLCLFSRFVSLFSLVKRHTSTPIILRLLRAFFHVLLLLFDIYIYIHTPPFLPLSHSLSLSLSLSHTFVPSASSPLSCTFGASFSKATKREAKEKVRH